MANVEVGAATTSDKAAVGQLLEIYAHDFSELTFAGTSTFCEPGPWKQSSAGPNFRICTCG